MKITITPQNITFSYRLYSIHIPNRYITYYIGPRGGLLPKYNPFGGSKLSLKIKSRYRRIDSPWGSLIGEIIYFFHRLLLLDFHITEIEDCPPEFMGNVELTLNSSPTTIFGKDKISVFLEELKSNNYQLNDVMERFDNFFEWYYKNSKAITASDKFFRIAILLLTILASTLLILPIKDLFSYINKNL